ncbi:MAG: NUDIX hydrolase [Bacilli bacterium]
MKIETREELDNLLKYCKVIPYSLPQDGGKFYKIKNQSFIYPDGKIQTREYIDKKRASVVVPITEEGRFVFVVQPIGLAEEGSLIEFPAGYFEFDENGMQAGIRELAEETGYVAEEVVYLGNHYQDPGSIKAKVDVYLAMNCKKNITQHLDDGEFIKYVELSYDLILNLLDDNILMDGNTYIAFSKAERYLQRKYDLNQEFSQRIK